MRMRLLALSLSVLLSVVSCATTDLEVQAHPGHAPWSWERWDWLPGESLVVHSPEPTRSLVELRLARLLQEGLAQRGLERSRGEAELHVGLVFAARRIQQATRRMGALESLSSFHNASFEVQAAETRIESSSLFRLAIYIVDARSGRLIWEGRITDQVQGEPVGAVTDAVEALLSRLPRRGEPLPETRLAVTTPGE